LLPAADSEVRWWWRLGRRELAAVAAAAAGLGLVLGGGLGRAVPPADVAAGVAVLFGCLAAAAKRASP
jgi:hypothetical protein